MEATLITASGEAKGKFELPQSVFGQEPSLRTLQEVIAAYQGNQRRGTSDTKTRAEVSGGGHKPWRQNSRGFYCATKLDDGSWCKERPAA